MAIISSPPCANAIKRSTLSRDDKPIDVEALLEENARLRNLVVQLSKLVIRNVAEPQ